MLNIGKNEEVKLSMSVSIKKKKKKPLIKNLIYTKSSFARPITVAVFLILGIHLILKINKQTNKQKKTKRKTKQIKNKTNKNKQANKETNKRKKTQKKLNCSTEISEQKL